MTAQPSEPGPDAARSEHFDVLVVGAGLSGIGAAHHLQTRCPAHSYVVVEARDRLGGTWDLFRYPGIRSDSDMHTLGYRFAPWTEAKAIADGPSILAYVRRIAEDNGILPKIRFRRRVVGLSWSTEDARWTVTIRDGQTGATEILTASFVYMCSGYYDYASGHTPHFAGSDRFAGTIVHPQRWPDDLDYAGKRVVVIGSGATAVTLVPALAEKAEHVTMLQRTPTYVVSRPAEDRIANRLRELLPERLAYGLTRWKNVVLGQAFYEACQRAPTFMRNLIRKGVRAQLGPDYDVDTHFNPPYGPWDQRMCLVPDADLFDAVRSGGASVVTDHVECFTEHGILLRSGEELPADIIVTATGLKVQILGGASMTVDGRELSAHDTMGYKSMMLSDVPNFALCFGYTNASWTLKADLTSEYVCRLLQHMRRHGQRICMPRRDPGVGETDFIGLKSGYIERAAAELPRSGDRSPWRLRQNYLLDLLEIRFGRIDDGVLELS